MQNVSNNLIPLAAS